MAVNALEGTTNSKAIILGSSWKLNPYITEGLKR
jgi:hypothetical protein